MSSKIVIAENGTYNIGSKIWLFDVRFYLERYDDVREAGVDPREHFTQHGAYERRYGSPYQLAHDVAIVSSSNRFDRKFYAEQYNIHSEQIEHYLLYYGMRSLKPNMSFEYQFFARHYPKTLSKFEPPFVCYCANHQKDWCYQNAQDLIETTKLLRQSLFVDPSYIRKQVQDLPADVDEIDYFVTEGFRYMVDPSREFSTRAYFIANDDLSRLEYNPIKHYILYGEAEGRKRYSIQHERIFTGRAFDKNLSTIVIVSHEASLSGAPIVALNLARRLASKFNIISVLLRGGKLIDHFISAANLTIVSGAQIEEIAAAATYVTANFELHAAIMNSIESTACLPVFTEHQIPTVSLVHEYASYVYPSTLCPRALLLSDVICFPSDSVKNQTLKQAAAHGLLPSNPRNVTVCPQGRSSPPMIATHTDAAAANPEITRGRDFIVAGAGWVQQRKGVDLFIEVARCLHHELKVPCKFLWAGPNYDPARDLQYSLYLHHQILQCGLAEIVHFVGEQNNLEVLFDVADIFFLSSRLDPYPNVALDALAAGKDVICFDGATGIADLAIIAPDRVLPVAYNDTRAVALLLKERYSSLELQPSDRKAQNNPALDDILSFERYTNEVENMISAAANNKERSKNLANLDEVPNVDPSIMLRTFPQWLTDQNISRVNCKILLEYASTAAVNGFAIGYIDKMGRTNLDLSPNEAEFYVRPIVQAGSSSVAPLYNRYLLDLTDSVTSGGANVQQILWQFPNVDTVLQVRRAALSCGDNAEKLRYPGVQTTVIEIAADDPGHSYLSEVQTKPFILVGLKPNGSSFKNVAPHTPDSPLFPSITQAASFDILFAQATSCDVADVPTEENDVFARINSNISLRLMRQDYIWINTKTTAGRELLVELIERGTGWRLIEILRYIFSNREMKKKLALAMLTDKTWKED